MNIVSRCLVSGTSLMSSDILEAHQGFLCTCECKSPQNSGLTLYALKWTLSTTLWILASLNDLVNYGKFSFT